MQDKLVGSIIIMFWCIGQGNCICYQERWVKQKHAYFPLGSLWIKFTYYWEGKSY